MNAVEDAYQILAQTVLDFVKSRDWDKAYCRCQIFGKMASSVHWLEYKNIEDKKSLGWPAPGLSASSAALFLRDDLFKTTGQRIWGLTFTLYPNGKFNIEYDYEKPEGYEETDELISGEEINRSLGQLGTPESDKES